MLVWNERATLRRGLVTVAIGCSPLEKTERSSLVSIRSWELSGHLTDRFG
jgi:hypothetical protein